MGTTVPLQIKTDLSVTDGINPEHKQEQRQSTKDAGPARRRRQQTSPTNTDEVEVLRLTNQRLIGELEQLTRQMQRPREARQTQEGHNLTPHEGQHILGTPRGSEIEAESSRAKGHGPHLAPGEEGNEATLGVMSGTRNYVILNKGWESDHGSKGSRASSRNLVA